MATDHTPYPMIEAGLQPTAPPQQQPAKTVGFAAPPPPGTVHFYAAAEEPDDGRCECGVNWTLFGLGFAFPICWLVAACRIGCLPASMSAKARRNERTPGIVSAVLFSIRLVGWIDHTLRHHPLPNSLVEPFVAPSPPPPPSIDQRRHHRRRRRRRRLAVRQGYERVHGGGGLVQLRQLLVAASCVLQTCASEDHTAVCVKKNPRGTRRRQEL
jgi:hypothetical protein